MRSSKRLIALLAGVALAAVGVAGCSDSEPAEPTEEVEVVEEAGGDEEAEEPASEAEEQEAAAEVAADFLTAWLTLIVGGDEQAEQAYEEADGDIDKFYDSFTLSKYFSLEGMSKAETDEFKDEFYYLGTMGVTDFDEDAPKLVFTLPADAVTVDGDTAVADMTQGTATIDGEVVDDAAEGVGFPEIVLVRDGGEWKVSGADFLRAAEEIPEVEDD